MKKKLAEGKKPCIWMEAGVIDYKICHNNFDCSHCEFDRAMTENANHNLALRRAGQTPTGKLGAIVPWPDKMRQRSGLQQQCRHMLTGRVPAHFCGNNYLCHRCEFDQLLEDQVEFFLEPERPKLEDVFGFAVPTTNYLHRGHTWAVLESGGRVRLGLDDFSQKVLGPADEMKLPKLGEEFHHDAVGLALARQGKKAAVLAPVDGIIEAVNPKVRQRPALAHDDPYGEGWLFVVTPTNLKPNLEHMLFGPSNVAWIEGEAHKLLNMLESSAGVTLPSGGSIIDDVYGHFPELDWQRLVHEFLHSV
ncbi:glycine cleavage system protein H [Desulfobacca acetoxidans]|uniref:Glycine cleavage H-protein n=1 Tax=Desulfobacca acetoxidans (strain ATCC 700848 / DSM 11109 / ASRB2) TaxID=880072 RepID=F2NC62_DESAR|nr:glycine cleavage system protein H [Desulfobacca acetoxidans]AEB08857.1 glycine cleavage H-protein [Desulfobacca acetoxidans DSM 11109]